MAFFPFSILKKNMHTYIICRLYALTLLHDIILKLFVTML
jgi:hypothetical protein